MTNSNYNRNPEPKSSAIFSWKQIRIAATIVPIISGILVGANAGIQLWHNLHSHLSTVDQSTEQVLQSQPQQTLQNQKRDFGGITSD